jgi:hypothetical protein
VDGDQIRNTAYADVLEQRALSGLLGSGATHETRPMGIGMGKPQELRKKP